MIVTKKYIEFINGYGVTAQVLLHLYFSTDIIIYTGLCIIYCILPISL